MFILTPKKADRCQEVSNHHFGKHCSSLNTAKGTQGLNSCEITSEVTHQFVNFSPQRPWVSNRCTDGPHTRETMTQKERKKENGNTNLICVGWQLTEQRGPGVCCTVRRIKEAPPGTRKGLLILCSGWSTGIRPAE